MSTTTARSGTSAEGIAARARVRWGAGAIWASVHGTRAERTGFAALLVTGGGVGLTPPYYGAEVFGPQVIGEWSVRRGCASRTGCWSARVASGYGARSRRRGRTLDDGDRK